MSKLLTIMSLFYEEHGHLWSRPEGITGESHSASPPDWSERSPPGGGHHQGAAGDDSSSRMQVLGRVWQKFGHQPSPRLVCGWVGWLRGGAGQMGLTVVSWRFVLNWSIGRFLTLNIRNYYYYYFIFWYFIKIPFPSVDIPEYDLSIPSSFFSFCVLYRFA